MCNLQIEFHQQMQKIWAEAFFFVWFSQRPKRIAQVPVVHPFILITSEPYQPISPNLNKTRSLQYNTFFFKLATLRKSNSKRSSKIYIYRVTETQQLDVVLQHLVQTVPAASYCESIKEKRVKAGRGKSELSEPKGSVITSSYLHSVLKRKKALINKIAMQLRELNIILWLFKYSQC